MQFDLNETKGVIGIYCFGAAFEDEKLNTTSFSLFFNTPD